MTLPFQRRVVDWARQCFGQDHIKDHRVRALRFVEEALELAQACGLSDNEVRRVLVYVYNRPTGDIHQEVAGTMLTLAVLADLHGVDMLGQGEAELVRCWSKTERIRAKDQAKPTFEKAE